MESNSMLRFLRPDVYVSVLDPGTADFKESAKRYLDRADAVVVTGGELDARSGRGFRCGWWRGRGGFRGRGASIVRRSWWSLCGGG